MTIASGIGATLATAEETVYGTYVAPTRGFEFEKHTLKWDKQTKQGAGLRGGGMYPRSARRRIVARQGGGDVEMDLATKGMGRWLKHCLGGTPTIVQVGATTAFTQTFVPGDLLGLSQTIQAGIPDTSGTMRALSYLGCVVTGWEIGVDNRDLARFKASVDARDCVTSEAYAAPSYTLATAANVFDFEGAELFVAGSVTPVAGNLKFSVSGSNKVKTDRFHTGAGGRKAAPIEGDWRETKVTVDSEFIDEVTWLARHFSDESFRLVMKFTGEEIAGAGVSESLTITVPDLRINTETPAVDGPGVVEHSLDLEVLDNGVDAPVTITYVSTDTAI